MPVGERSLARTFIPVRRHLLPSKAVPSSVTKASESEDKSLPSLTREPPISHRILPAPQSEA
ncbi:MAG: hypothetical protein IJV44_01070 [Prevotella sp.]|nr:hypothetical protein [Prevotella sp.]